MRLSVLVLGVDSLDQFLFLDTITDVALQVADFLERRVPEISLVRLEDLQVQDARKDRHVSELTEGLIVIDRRAAGALEDDFSWTWIPTLVLAKASDPIERTWLEFMTVDHFRTQVAEFIKEGFYGSWAGDRDLVPATQSSLGPAGGGGESDPGAGDSNQLEAIDDGDLKRIQARLRDEWMFLSPEEKHAVARAAGTSSEDLEQCLSELSRLGRLRFVQAKVLLERLALDLYESLFDPARLDLGLDELDALARAQEEYKWRLDRTLQLTELARRERSTVVKKRQRFTTISDWKDFYDQMFRDD